MTGGGDGTVRLWDHKGQELDTRWYLLGDEQTATVRNGNEIVTMTDGAWRRLRSIARDKVIGAMRVHRVEAFGPVPITPDRLA